MKLSLILSEQNGEPKYKTDKGKAIDPKEMKMGIEVEHEHAPTIRKIKAYIKEHGEWPAISLIAEWISTDHFAECGKYYTFLKKMEGQCKNADKKNLKEDVNRVVVYSGEAHMKDGGHIPFTFESDYEIGTHMSFIERVADAIDRDVEDIVDTDYTREFKR